MTEDTTPENLRKFLESEDSVMRLMGISMAKAVNSPEANEIVKALSFWDVDEQVKNAAKKSLENGDYDDPAHEALECFKKCPLMIQINYFIKDPLEIIRDKSHKKYFYNSLMETTDKIISLEPPAEMLDPPTELKDLIFDLSSYLNSEEWKPRHNSYTPDRGWRDGGTYALAYCIINFERWLCGTQNYAANELGIIDDACKVIETLHRNILHFKKKGTSELASIPSWESNDDDTFDYFKIISTYGSKDNTESILPLLSLTGDEEGYSKLKDKASETLEALDSRPNSDTRRGHPTGPQY